MGQTATVGTHKTTVSSNDYWAGIVTYHQTQVVKWNPELIILDTGGWRTVTTKLRMMQARNQFRLPYGVCQRKGEWYVSGFDWEKLKYGEDIRMTGDRVLINRLTGEIVNID